MARKGPEKGLRNLRCTARVNVCTLHTRLLIIFGQSAAKSPVWGYQNDRRRLIFKNLYPKFINFTFCFKKILGEVFVEGMLVLTSNFCGIVSRKVLKK